MVKDKDIELGIATNWQAAQKIKQLIFNMAGNISVGFLQCDYSDTSAKYRILTNGRFTKPQSAYISGIIDTVNAIYG